MRITIINQFYPPDLSPTGKLAAALAEHRAAQGDEVTVISGIGYAENTLPHTDHNRRIHVENSITDAESQFPTLNIRRIWTPQLGKRSMWRRAIDYATYFALTSWTVCRLPRQDVVICLTTPPFILIAGALHKLRYSRVRKRGSINHEFRNSTERDASGLTALRTPKLVLWNMDCYPEVAERAGVIRENGIVSRLMQFVNRRLQSTLDYVVCLDHAMHSLVTGRKGTTPPAGVIPNWERLRLFPRRDVNHSTDTQNDLSEFTVLYSGNMGHGHCFQTVLAAAKRLQDQRASVRFVFTGGGVVSCDLQRQVEQSGLNNIEFRGYVPATELRELQASAGCSLITLKEDMLGVMSPSKLHSSLAMSLPVLYVGPEGSNVDVAIKRFDCGKSVRNHDVNGFVQFLEEARSNPLIRLALGTRARQAFEEAYCDELCLPEFDRVIADVAGEERQDAGRLAG